MDQLWWEAWGQPVAGDGCMHFGGGVAAAASKEAAGVAAVVAGHTGRACMGSHNSAAVVGIEPAADIAGKERTEHL